MGDGYHASEGRTGMSEDVKGASDALLGRQPIVDRELRTVGYELLYRGTRELGASFVDGAQATTTVLSHMLVDFGLDEVVGTKQAWINVPERFLLDQLPLPVEPSRLVLEVQQADTEQLAGALARYRKAGYAVALAGTLIKPESGALLEQLDYIKVDARLFAGNELPTFLRDLQKRGIALVAEKVETRLAYEQLRGLGFDRFQGYFMAEPQLLERKRPSASRIALVRLLTEVLSPQASLRRIEELVTQDAVLSYRLLRCLNSGVYALPRRVESIQHAVVLLGVLGLRNLVAVLAMARVDDRPEEIMIIGLTRARFCERMGSSFQGTQPESLFTVGLFSVMDALMGEPMDQVLQRIPLSDELGLALLEGQGNYGRALKLVEAQELGEWETVEELGFDGPRVSEVWLQAVRWAESLKRLLVAPPPAAEKGGKPPGRPAR